MTVACNKVDLLDCCVVVQSVGGSQVCVVVFWGDFESRSWEDGVGQRAYAEGDRMFSLHLEMLFIGKDGYRATKGKMSFDVDYNIFIHMIFN